MCGKFSVLTAKTTLPESNTAIEKLWLKTPFELKPKKFLHFTQNVIDNEKPSKIIKNSRTVWKSFVRHHCLHTMGELAKYMEVGNCHFLLKKLPQNIFLNSEKNQDC